MKMELNPKAISILQNPNQSAADLNQDLNQISFWTLQWKMSFNLDPNKQSSKSKPSKIYFNNVKVKRVSERNDVGLILELKLSSTSTSTSKSTYTYVHSHVLRIHTHIHI